MFFLKHRVMEVERWKMRRRLPSSYCCRCHHRWLIVKWLVRNLNQALANFRIISWLTFIWLVPPQVDSEINGKWTKSLKCYGKLPSDKTLRVFLCFQWVEKGCIGNEWVNGSCTMDTSIVDWLLCGANLFLSRICKNVEFLVQLFNVWCPLNDLSGNLA